jgi:hypothetical protein
MAYLIGTDEAGYGPNLGPLVVAATVWHVPDELMDGDLYERLGEIVTRDLAVMSDGASAASDGARNASGYQIRIGDSKQLYRPGGGLLQLEQGVLTCLAATGLRPRCWSELTDAVCRGSMTSVQQVPWHLDFDLGLPTCPDGACTAEQLERWQQVADGAGVRPVQLRAAMVFPWEFNQQLALHQSKGTLLSLTTLRLVADLLSELDGEPVRVLCDKHGGRNHYAALLQPFFPDRLVRVATEGQHVSRYEIDQPGRTIRFRFQVGGEADLPSALASMLAKYLRELSMRAFNRFWQCHVDGLRPTAGYPGDAHRFRRDIEDCQRQLRISDEVLWRAR